MPVAAFLDSPLGTKHVVLLPDHQVRYPGLDRPFTFGALIGFQSIDRRDVLHIPVPVLGPLHSRGRVKDTGNIAPSGAGFLPLAGGGPGVRVGAAGLR